MPNLHRGEIESEIGGARRRLVLTLGALAELEAAFGAEDLAALAGRFGSGRLSARDLIRIIGAGLRGAGEAISDDEVARLTMPDGAAGYVRLAAALLDATFAGDPASTSAAAADWSASRSNPGSSFARAVLASAALTRPNCGRSPCSSKTMTARSALCTPAPGRRPMAAVRRPPPAVRSPSSASCSTRAARCRQFRRRRCRTGPTDRSSTWSSPVTPCIARRSKSRRFKTASPP